MYAGYKHVTSTSLRPSCSRTFAVAATAALTPTAASDPASSSATACMRNTRLTLQPVHNDTKLLTVRDRTPSSMRCCNAAKQARGVEACCENVAIIRPVRRNVYTTSRLKLKDWRSSAGVTLRLRGHRDHRAELRHGRPGIQAESELPQKFRGRHAKACAHVPHDVPKRNTVI